MSDIIQPNDPMVQQAMQAEQRAQMQQAAIQQMAEQIRLQLVISIYAALLPDYDLSEAESTKELMLETKRRAESGYPVLMELLGFKAVE